MAANVNKWSETPASNATADPAINWAEGQAPSTVNDSARQMMAAIAADRDDTRGSLTFGGTSAALTLATNSGNATYQNGMRVSGKLASAFTANATLNVDSVGAKNIYRYNNAGAGQVQAADGFTGQHVTFEYEAALNSSAGGWVLLGEPVGRVVGIQVLVASGTYTRNPAASTGDIYVYGGGSAGGSCPATAAGQFAIAGAGASGAVCISMNVALPATATATIGAAGVPGAAGSNPGGAGGQSSLVGGSINMVAPGGPGGSAGSAFTSSVGTAADPATFPAIATGGGAVNSRGQIGVISLAINSNLFGGSGGPGPWGGAGARNNPATGPSSGGGACILASSLSAAQGGAGGAGMIIVVERA